MFKVQKNSIFKRQVTVITPTDDGETKGTFTARFKRIPHSQIEAAMSSADVDADLTLLDKVLVGVEGIADEDGNPLPDNDDTISLIKEDSCARTATVSEYFAATIKKNQRKN